MDLLDQMLAEAEASMNVTEHEELDQAIEAGGLQDHPSDHPPAPDTGAIAVPNFMVVGASSAGWGQQAQPESHDLTQLSASAEAVDAESEGPPPPPEGAENAPRPHWGTCHLCNVNASSASAKFGGGGSSDVPTACSKIMATGPSGRAYWEVRFDKKGAGLVKVGLAYFHEGGPGDPGACFRFVVSSHFW